MNIEECYQALGGNYAEVSSRLPSQRLIEKFIGKFLEDESFDTLCRQIELGNREEAFRAAHTLKGISANLSFTRLLDSVSRLTEELRGQADSVSEEALGLYDEVRLNYGITADTIRKFFTQENP